MLWRRRPRSADAEGAVIQAPPVSLVPTSPHHVDAWLDAASSSEESMRRWQPTWPEGHLTAAAFRDRTAYWTKQRANGTGFCWHIYADGDLAGAAELSKVTRGAVMSASLGYWIADRDSGRGYATAATRALCAQAFEDLGLVRVEATCAPENTASLRVLAKVGFATEGLARAYLEVGGIRRDHVMLARVRDDLAG